ncbi:ankyrin repeat domain-containing protein [Paenibacillus azoreducens]|uniref:ankyrin repeat domain-containing protein n=1 Tax=Paenibacillus azoreducens TaxID=116718 RepID=UPI0039F462AC
MLVNLESPVELLEYKLYQSKSTGKLYCSLTFNNVSDKKVKGLKLRIYCFDQFGDPIEEEMRGFEARVEMAKSAASNTPFGMEDKIEVDQRFSSARKIEVDITKVLFDDQTIWTKNEIELEKVELVKIENPKQLAYVRNHSGVNAKYFSQNFEDRWSCICGRLNYGQSPVCKRCGLCKDNVLSLYGSEEMIQKNLEIEERERQKKEQEERERHIFLSKQKKKKIIGYGLTSVITLLIIGIAAFGFMTEFTFSIDKYELLKDKDRSLRQAVQSENITNVKFLIKHGANVNDLNDERKSILFSAIKSGNQEIVMELLNAGASVEQLGQGKNAPLQLSVEFGHVNLAKLFVEKGYDANSRNDKEENLLYTAIASGNIEMVDFLTGLKGTKLVNLDKAGNNALQAAFIHKQFNPRLIDKLLKSNLDLNKENNNGENTYFTALKYGDIAVIKKFHDNGMNLNHIDSEGNNALHLLVRERNTDLEKLIGYCLDSGVKINAFDKKGFSPLYHAIVSNKALITKILLEKGADTSRITKSGKSAAAVVRSQGKKLGDDIRDLVYDSVFIISYAINDDGFISYTPNHHPIKVGINQKITLEPTYYDNAYDRVLIDGNKLDFLDADTIRAVRKGRGKVTIIPFGYNWEDAKEYEVIIE